MRGWLARVVGTCTPKALPHPDLSPFGHNVFSLYHSCPNLRVICYPTSATCFLFEPGLIPRLIAVILSLSECFYMVATSCVSFPLSGRFRKTHKGIPRVFVEGLKPPYKVYMIACRACISPAVPSVGPSLRTKNKQKQKRNETKILK